MMAWVKSKPWVRAGVVAEFVSPGLHLDQTFRQGPEPEVWCTQAGYSVAEVGGGRHTYNTGAGSRGGGGAALPLRQMEEG